MTSNEIYARVKENEFVNAPTHRVNVIDENGVIRLSRPCWGLDMAESIAADREGEFDGWTVEIVEQENRDEIQAYWDKENTEPTNPDNNPTTMNAKETTVTVSITDNGNKCEYTADGKVLAAITYRKEFDTYDVNAPTVGYMTANVTEAHKVCESGVNWLLGHNATFDYSAVEEYNAKPYAEI